MKLKKNIGNNSRIDQTTLYYGSGGNLILGSHSQIRAYSIIEMDNGTLSIGNNSVLGYYTFIQCTGEIAIGNGCLLGPHCCFISSSHPINDKPLIGQPLIRGKIKIGNNVWIGANCTININVEIGNNCIIGANSFVNSNIPDNTVFAGSPAKYIRER